MKKSRKLIYSLAIFLLLQCLVNIVFTLSTAGSARTSTVYAVEAVNKMPEPVSEAVIEIKREPAGITAQEYAGLAPKVTMSDAYFSNQWALARIQNLPVYRRYFTGYTPVVAVLDTGIDHLHIDLTGRVGKWINFSSSSSAQDVNGHGTHVAGIIGAIPDNGTGIAGVLDKAILLNVKVAEDSGLVWASSIAKGIIWAVDNGAKVINMSMSVPSQSAELERAVKYAWDKGVVLVAAVGNYTKSPPYPAAYPEVIGVAALNPDGTLWKGSNDGDFVDAYAPGADILSTLPSNKYDYMSGSSMATAHVSAVAAMALESVEDTNENGRVNDEIKELMRQYFQKPR